MNEEVSVELAIHKPNQSISIKRADEHKSKTIQELIDELNKASIVKVKYQTSQK